MRDRYLSPSSPLVSAAMAGFYSMEAWTSADLATFQHHYDSALAKVTDSDAKIISDFDAMKGLMRKYEAVETMVLPPHVVGINAANRDEKLMSAAEMSVKGSKIISVGASKDLCDFNRAWCTQDDPDTRESYHWTVKTAASSEFFGTPSMSIGFGSIGCSHWNQFLHAVNCERPTPIDECRSQRGVLYKHKIFTEDKTFQELATGGLTWSVIKSGFVKQYPLVPKLFSKALNTEHNIAIGETWDQQISSIVSVASTFGDQADIPWDKIKKQVAASQGPYIRDLPNHMSFIKKYGGGRPLSHIRDSLSYLHCRMPANRKVSGQFVTNLTAIPLSADFQIPRMVHALFMAHACCAEMDCDDNNARYISVSDTKSLNGAKRAKTLEAESTLARLKQVMEVSNRSSVMEYGDAAVKIAKSVLGKTKETIQASNLWMSTHNV